MKAIFSRVRHPSHPGRGHGSLTCLMTQVERSDWLRSENFINIMMEYLPMLGLKLNHVSKRGPRCHYRSMLCHVVIYISLHSVVTYVIDISLISYHLQRTVEGIHGIRYILHAKYVCHICIQQKSKRQRYEWVVLYCLILLIDKQKLSVLTYVVWYEILWSNSKEELLQLNFARTMLCLKCNIASWWSYSWIPKMFLSFVSIHYMR